jgi:hypothetical protein
MSDDADAGAREAAAGGHGEIISPGWAFFRTVPAKERESPCRQVAVARKRLAFGDGCYSW